MGTTGRHRKSQQHLQDSLRVIPEAQKAIEGANVEIELAEEMDQITFYSKALGLLLWAGDGH